MPERELWQSVLLLAIEDALNGPSDYGTKLHRTEQRIAEINRTRIYLTTPNEDLAIVCANAGMDMQALIERMKVRIADAPPPEELAQGKRQRIQEKIAKRMDDDNQRSTKRMKFADFPVTIGNETRTVHEWAELNGIPTKLACQRIARGMDATEAVSMTAEDMKARLRNFRRQSHMWSYQRERRTPRAEGLVAAPSGRKRRARNTNVTLYAHNGESLSIREWSDRLGIKINTLRKRLKMGWLLAEVFTVSAPT